MMTSLRETTWTRVQAHWITGLLLGAVVITWLSMLSTTERLQNTETIAAVMISGVLYGALLAASRFRGRTAWSINIITSLGLAILIVGRLLPDPASWFGQPLPKSLWLMNVRLVTLAEVLRSDTQWMATDYFLQTRLFLWLNVLAVWNAAVWLMWGVLRRRRALVAVLPLALLGVVYTALSKTGPQISALFILACVLLLARTAYVYQTHDWQRRDIGFPDLIGEDWTMWAAILSIAVVVLAGISTPEWRDSFQHFLESLRPPPPQPERVIVPALVQEAPTSNYIASFVPKMDYVGEAFPSSDQTVFYVVTSDVPAGIEGNGWALPPKQKHYWRGAIFDRYTGSGWEPLTIDTAAPPMDTALIDPGRYALKQQFDIVALQGDHLFAADQPVEAGNGTILQVAQDDPTAVLPRGNSARYEITSWAPRVKAQELEAASTDYPAQIRAKYLQLPDTVPQRVKDLAARLTTGSTSPYDKAVRLQEYLRTTYPYKLDVPAPPPNRDVVDYFLFDAPGGFCSYYATAMAVMLRTQGVPARVVDGFMTGEYDGYERRYRVPAKAAHAWVEVYFPGYGWIEFEPTAAQEVFDYTTKEELPDDQLPELPASRSETAAPTSISLAVPGAVLVLGLLGAAAYLVWRRYTQSRLTPELQARKLYWETRRSLRQLEVEVAPSATPAEFRAACADRLADQPRLRDAIDTVIESYIRAVFTSTPPDRSDVKIVQRAWRVTWRHRLSLRLRLYARHLRGQPVQTPQRDR